MTDYAKVRAILDADWPASNQRRHRRAVVAVALAPALLAVAEAADALPEWLMEHEATDALRAALAALDAEVEKL